MGVQDTAAERDGRVLPPRASKSLVWLPLSPRGREPLYRKTRFTENVCPRAFRSEGKVFLLLQEDVPASLTLNSHPNTVPRPRRWVGHTEGLVPAAEPTLTF